MIKQIHTQTDVRRLRGRQRLNAEAKLYGLRQLSVDLCHRWNVLFNASQTQCECCAALRVYGTSDDDEDDDDDRITSSSQLPFVFRIESTKIYFGFCKCIFFCIVFSFRFDFFCRCICFCCTMYVCKSTCVWVYLCAELSVLYIPFFYHDFFSCFQIQIVILGYSCFLLFGFRKIKKKRP